jgi:hypothetical protein
MKSQFTWFPHSIANLHCQNGNHTDRHFVVYPHWDAFLENCTSMFVGSLNCISLGSTMIKIFRLGSRVRRVFDIEGRELQEKDTVRICDRSMLALLGRVSGPYWVSAGEPVAPKGITSLDKASERHVYRDDMFLAGFIQDCLRKIASRMKELKAEQESIPESISYDLQVIDITCCSLRSFAATSPELICS